MEIINCPDLEPHMSTVDAVSHRGLQVAVVGAETPPVLPPRAALRLSCPLTTRDSEGFSKMTNM